MFQIIKKHDSLAKRIILLAFTTISLSMILTGSIIIWNFQKSQIRNLNTYLAAYIDILIAATTIDQQDTITIHDNISVFHNMPFYWQITTNGQLLKKSPLIKEQINIDNLENGLSNLYIGDKNTKITVVVKNIIFPGNKKINYLFGMQYEIADAMMREEQNKFTGSLFIILILLSFFLIITIALIQIRASTKPLQKIKLDITDIHEGNSKKLDNKFPKEIRLLATEINKLIDYNLSIIERYSTFAANLSHALKTPLTIMNNEAKQPSSKLAQTVRDKSNDMLELIDRNLTRANVIGTSNTLSSNVDIIPITNKIADSFGKLYDKKVEIIHESESLIFQGNKSDLYEILGNIIENGYKYSKSYIKITLNNINNNLIIIIEDDGPGIPQKELKNVFKYGTRLDETKPGSGIGLTVISDIIHFYDGKLDLNSSILGGLKVTITLPHLR